MTERYTKAGETIRDEYTEKHYSLDEVPCLLNRLYYTSMTTKRDVEHSIELKAVNRHLRIENRVLTLKLQQLAWRGMVDISEIEKENFELKQKLKALGKYNGDVLR